MDNLNTPLPETSGSEEAKIEVIKPETIVSIQMSSGFYKKIQNMLAHLLNGKTTEELNDAHTQISEDKITQEWVTHYETLLILAKEFEETARKEGFIVKVTADEAAELFKDDL